MASWKKIIVSGSDAELNALSLSGLSNQGSEATAVMINGSGVVGTRELASNAFTSTTIGTTTNNLTVDNSTLQLNSGTTFNGSAARTISVKGTGITAEYLGSDVAGSGLTGGNGAAIAVGAGTGIDVSTNAIAVDVSDFMTNGSNNRVLTATGADAMNAEADLTFDGSNLDINTSNSKLAFNGQVIISGSHALLHIGDTEEQANGAQIQINDTTQTFKVFASGGTATSATLNVLGHVSASSISASGHVHATKYFGDGSGLSNLTSAANGTLTLATSGAINGSATFGANDSGDTTFTVSIDNATTSALGAASFDSGDFSVSSGAVSIKADGVSYSQIQNVTTTNRILGRDSSGAGVIEEITPANVKTMLSLNNVPNSNHEDAGYSTVTQLNASSSALQDNITTNANAIDTNATAIDNNIIDSGNRLNANLIHDGSISNTEFGHLNNIGSNIQTQLNAKAALAGATFSGDVVVEGDLTVNGDLTTVNTTNLLVEDKFTTFASGSTSSTDGGIVIQGAASAGQGFGWDSGTDRWAFDKDLSISATAIVPDGYVAIVSGSAQDASGNPSYGGSSNGYGNIHINTTSGDIFIYV